MREWFFRTAFSKTPFTITIRFKTTHDILGRDSPSRLATTKATSLYKYYYSILACGIWKQGELDLQDGLSCLTSVPGVQDITTIFLYITQIYPSIHSVIHSFNMSLLLSSSYLLRFELLRPSRVPSYLINPITLNHHLQSSTSIHHPNRQKNAISLTQKTLKPPPTSQPASPSPP